MTPPRQPAPPPALPVPHNVRRHPVPPTRFGTAAAQASASAVLRPPASHSRSPIAPPPTRFGTAAAQASASAVLRPPASHSRSPIAPPPTRFGAVAVQANAGPALGSPAKRPTVIAPPASGSRFGISPPTRFGTAAAQASASAELVQCRLAPGIYDITKTANLRVNDANYTSLGRLNQGALVKIESLANTPGPSNFKAGWVTNEHSWVESLGAGVHIRGWVEDGKLAKTTSRKRLLKGSLWADGYQLKDVGGPLEFLEIVGQGALIYWRNPDPNLLPPIRQFLTGQLTLYRGIPIWHRNYEQAVKNRLVPMGNGPPDFVTSASRYIPFADGLGEAVAAAKASTGQSNPGQRGGVHQLSAEEFDVENQDQEIGRVFSVTVSAATHDEICFFNPGEFQVAGPLDCNTYQIFRIRDLNPREIDTLRQRVRERQD
jgi:hypothetical protein